MRKLLLCLMLLSTMVLGRESDKELEKQMQEDEVQSCGEALDEQRLCGTKGKCCFGRGDRR